MKNEVKIVYYGEKENKSLSSIYEKRESLPLIFQIKKLEKYQSFQDIRDKILEKLKSGKSGKNSKIPKMSEDEPFYLYIGEQIGKDFDMIFNEDSYNFFLRKIILNGPSEGNQFFFILIKDKEKPKWTPKYVETFNKALEEDTKASNEYIRKTVTLLKLEQGKSNFDKNKEIFKGLMASDKIHENVICNKCLGKGFTGPRYICSECLNYNLCSICESKLMDEQFHNKNHGFILINKPINEDINQYKNVIYPKKQEIADPSKDFTVQFKIANSGTKNLKECYITSLKYGPSYLGCKKLVISEDFEIKNVKDIKLDLSLPEEYENGNASGVFRMFTKEGLPFGDTIHITVFGGKK